MKEFTWKHNYTSEDTFKPIVTVNVQVQRFQMQTIKFPNSAILSLFHNVHTADL